MDVSSDIKRFAYSEVRTYKMKSGNCHSGHGKSKNTTWLPEVN